MRLLICSISLACLAATAAAHEFWIEPSSFRPVRGDRVSLTLRVGDGFPGETYARNPAHLRAFEFLRNGNRVPIPGVAGRSPAGWIRWSGPCVVGYRSHPARITLPAKEFDAYLKEEGLDTVRRLRAERGETARPGVESYSRCAKTLLGGGDAWLGYALEIKRDGKLFLVRHQGKPLANALVRAFHRGVPPLSAQTDKHGRVRFKLSDGIWMIGVVHMTAAPKESGADWESLWASLTLQTGDCPRQA